MLIELKTAPCFYTDGSSVVLCDLGLNWRDEVLLWLNADFVWLKCAGLRADSHVCTNCGTSVLPEFDLKSLIFSTATFVCFNSFRLRADEAIDSESA